jgi:hypothetical protein
MLAYIPQMVRLCSLSTPSMSPHVMQLETASVSILWALPNAVRGKNQYPRR